ncbi:hypothetical protein Agub_g11067 [Astrephomene gubernaculifera]|uniref:Uncharacterized protein n=1 Tax=Astrephomene gubernaculifera TaxID=47775 RepID=A0AAD3DYP5_9CHLO|nr:hypothetical protein Agub_g11067 [Astrephomene gubernaculifera]
MYEELHSKEAEPRRQGGRARSIFSVSASGRSSPVQQEDTHDVVLPMRTGLRVHEVPYGLQLAGITTGYRLGGTYMDCLKTLFTWHNQTLNSWTMIFGWLVSCCMLSWSWQQLRPSGMDLVAFLALWLCPTLHLPFTVGYHQFLCISPEVLRRWRALDVAFIFIASIPLTFALSYFVLPLPYSAALTAVTLGLSLHAWHNAAALPAAADIDKKANTRYVGYVVLVYTFPILLQAALDLAAVLGLGGGGGDGAGAAAADNDILVSSGSGAAHLSYAHVPLYDRLYSVKCAAAIVFCFVYAGATYVSCFPDIYAPGYFDHVGAAQQLMHLGVAGAHAVEWLFAIHMVQRRRLHAASLG